MKVLTIGAGAVPVFYLLILVKIPAYSAEVETFCRSRRYDKNSADPQNESSWRVM
jgi:hypothetical protein